MLCALCIPLTSDVSNEAGVHVQAHAQNGVCVVEAPRCLVCFLLGTTEKNKYLKICFSYFFSNFNSSRDKEKMLIKILHAYQLLRYHVLML